MSLSSCSKARCQTSWHPSNQIIQSERHPNLLDVPWPRAKGVGPYLQSLVKWLIDIGSRAKCNMPNKSVSHSPNRQTFTSWVGLFLRPRVFSHPQQRSWRTQHLCTLFSTLSTDGKPTLLIFDRSWVQWQLFLSYCQPWQLVQCKYPLKFNAMWW